MALKYLLRRQGRYFLESYMAGGARGIFGEAPFGLVIGVQVFGPPLLLVTVAVVGEDGPSALAMLETHPVDAVITDQIMPKGMTGIELAGKARENHPNLGFVFISGYADALDAAVAGIGGNDQSLGKPFSQDALVEAIRKVLKRESEEKYRSIFDNAQVGIIRSRISDGKPLEANDRLAEILGYENREDAIANHRADNHWVDPRDRKAWIAEGMKFGFVRNFDGQLKRKDGSIVYISSSATFNTEQDYVDVVMVDQTERTKAAQAVKEREEDLRLALIDAERANQAKSDFLATMSHELRTPLNAIIGFSDMIEGQFFGALGSEKYKEYAHDIHNSSEHLMALINDILDLSAIEAGQQSLVKEKLSVDEVADDCARIIVSAASEKNIEFSVEVPDDLPPLWADRRAVKQILFNLLTNAVKYTLEGGTILLKAKATDGFYFLEVGDTGIGVPREKLSTLTDPFVRSEADPYKSQEGSGLGLAIVNSLVDLHGGELNINSEVGVGTTVTVMLPNEPT